MKSARKAEFSEIFKDPLHFEITPKLISNLPNFEKNYNSISNDLIISHCFPKGIKITDNANEAKTTHFEFNLDNIPNDISQEKYKIAKKCTIGMERSRSQRAYGQRGSFK